LPWGSDVITPFQEYLDEGIIFEFVSSCGEYAATSQLGTVYMSTNYDPDAPPLTTELQFGNNEYTTLEKPSKSFIHPIECARSTEPIKVKYVVPHGTMTTRDKAFTDIGLFQITTVGNTTNGEIGKLYCTYKIKTLKPRLENPIIPPSAVLPFFEASIDNTSPGNSIGILGTAGAVLNSNNNLGLILSGTPTGGTLSITFPPAAPGNYMLYMNVADADSSSETANLLAQPTITSSVSQLLLTSAASSGSCVDSYSSATSSYRSIMDTFQNNNSVVFVSIPYAFGGIVNFTVGSAVFTGTQNSANLVVLQFNSAVTSKSAISLNNNLNALQHKLDKMELLLRKQDRQLRLEQEERKENYDFLPQPVDDLTESTVLSRAITILSGSNKKKKVDGA